MVRRPTLTSIHRDIFALTELVTHLHGMVHTMTKIVTEIQVQLAAETESVEAETSVEAMKNTPVA